MQEVIIFIPCDSSIHSDGAEHVRTSGIGLGGEGTLVSKRNLFHEAYLLLEGGNKNLLPVLVFISNVGFYAP